MKKLLIAVCAGVLSIPAFADSQKTMPAPGAVPMEQVGVPQHPGLPGDFKQAREKHEAQMKATQDKVNKLIAEYKKLKPGKKKEAKKTEIVEFVSGVRNEQIQFKEKHLAGFEKRLNHMKKELAEQSTPEAKKNWVDQRTERLIAQDGDLKVLFDKPEGAPDMSGPRNGKHGMRGGHPGMKDGKGPRPGKEGMFPGKGPQNEGPQVPPQEIPQAGPQPQGPVAK